MLKYHKLTLIRTCIVAIIFGSFRSWSAVPVSDPIYMSIKRPIIYNWTTEMSYNPFTEIMDTIMYIYDFNDGGDEFNQWSHYDRGDNRVAWHESTTGGFRNSKGLWCGVENDSVFGNGYGDNWYKSCETGKLGIDEFDWDEITLYLSFLSSYALEPKSKESGKAYDGINVQIKTAEVDWTTLSFESYNASNISAYDMYDEVESIGWTGEDKGWHAERIDLREFLSDEIQLRFTLASDQNYSTVDNGYLFGWRIDNIDISIWDANGNEEQAQLYYYDGGDEDISNGGEELTFYFSSLLPTTQSLWKHMTWGTSNILMGCQNSSGEYIPNMKNVIVSPDLYVTNNQNNSDIRLDFEVFGSLQDEMPGDDYWMVEITPDFGTSWYNIASLDRTTQKQKFISIKDGNTSGYYRWFSNMYPGVEMINLSSFYGDTIQLRYSFYSDGDVPPADSREGLLIDNIKIYSVDQNLTMPFDVRVNRDGDDNVVSWLSNKWKINPRQWDDNHPDAYVNFHNEYGISYPIQCGLNDSVLLEDVLVYCYYNSSFDNNNDGLSLSFNAYLYSINEDGKPRNVMDSKLNIVANPTNLEPTVFRFPNSHYYKDGETIFIGVRGLAPGGIPANEAPLTYADSTLSVSSGSYDYQGLLADKSIYQNNGWVKARTLVRDYYNNETTRSWEVENKWMSMHKAYNGDLNIPIMRITTIDYSDTAYAMDNYVVSTYKNGSDTGEITVDSSATSYSHDAPMGSSVDEYEYTVKIKYGSSYSPDSRKVSISVGSNHPNPN